MILEIIIDPVIWSLSKLTLKYMFFLKTGFRLALPWHSLVTFFVIRLLKLIIPSFMVYDHNSRGQFFCNLPAKINDVIWWDLSVPYSFLNFSHHFSMYSDTLKRFYNLNRPIKDSTKHEPWDYLNLPSSFVMLHFTIIFLRTSGRWRQASDLLRRSNVKKSAQRADY